MNEAFTVSSSKTMEVFQDRPENYAFIILNISQIPFKKSNGMFILLFNFSLYIDTVTVPVSRGIIPDKRHRFYDKSRFIPVWIFPEQQ
jgi:hypothetical protein